MHPMLISLAALSFVAPQSPAQAPAEAPKETIIKYAANGGIRNFQAGPAGSDIIFLQDRTQRWYRVTLSGPCLPDRSLQTLTFRTNADGNFDRFSEIGSTRYPTRVCGVRSIVASPPPAGQPGAPKP